MTRTSHSTIGCITLTLPEPPSSNRYWRHVGRNVVVSREAKAYRNAVLAAWLARPARDRVRLTGQVAVDFTWYRSRRSGDLDNRIKQLLDALCQCAYVDDAQIVEIRARRADDKANPRVELTLTPINTTP